MCRLLATFVLLIALAACASRPIRTSVPPSTPASAPASVQSLYESGRDEDIINRTAVDGGSARPSDIWFAAQSQLRLGRRAEALDDLSRLAASDSDPGAQLAARLATARLTNDVPALDRLRGDAAAVMDSVFVQYELGLSYAAQNDFASAARAFDRCIEIAPMFAYAYYQSALAYDRLNRGDLMANRFDRFVRLAPNAPERPQVDSILRTLAGR